MLIGVWSLFIHSVWLATYLLYLIVSSSVLVTVAFLESVTSVNILNVRNYFLRIRIFWYYCGMLSCACSFILCDRSNSVTSGLQHICCAVRCMEPVHSLSVACKIPALPYCVIICSGYRCLSGVSYFCCLYPQGKKLFFKKEEFFFVIILVCFYVPVHSFYVIAETVSLLACNILAVYGASSYTVCDC